MVSVSNNAIEKIECLLPLTCWTIARAIEYGFMVTGIEEGYIKAIMM
ncbi:MAG: hypothetical protein ACRDD7_03500 [Peptostreptococcaceae bacterium]